MRESGSGATVAGSLGSYANFDLVIEKNNDDYRAYAKSSYGGEAQCDFKSPFTGADLETIADRLDRSRAMTRRITTPQLSLAKEMGGRLHAAVVGPEIRTALARAMDSAERDGLTGVRIRLHLAGAPDLAVLPWEFLFDPDPRVGRFLALADESPLVRYLDLPDQSRPLKVIPPLRVLVVVSSPADDRYPELDVEREWALLQEALAQPIKEGLLEVERLPRATVAALSDALQANESQILHFIGHGRFDEQHQDGVLAFEGERGGAQEVSAEHLGTLLYNERGLRLVVINACEGGRASATDPYAGMAQTLVRMRVPAVVAMQYEITDRAAILFARQFYRGIAAGRPVDTAITDARLAIFAQVSDLEWATPVLYMRAPDGRIFDIAPRVGAAAPALRPSLALEPAAVLADATSSASPVTALAGSVSVPISAEAAAAAVLGRGAAGSSVAGGPAVEERGGPRVVAPTSAAPSSIGPAAGFGRRTVAYLIDVFAVALGVSVFEAVLGEPLPTELAWAASGVYFVACWSSAGSGRTIGMRVLGLRVVRSDGAPLDLGRALLRFVGMAVSVTALGIGLLWAAFDAKKRGWHDMLADTLVVRADR